MSEKLNLSNIAKEYNSLLPNQIEGLVIFLLNKQIADKEIPNEFTQIEIKSAIHKVAKLISLSTIPQTERIIATLIPYFLYRTPQSHYTKYVLTQYAERLVHFVETKLDSPHRKFPLKNSFEKYFNIKVAEIKTIADLEEWFQNGFKATSKHTVEEHIEAFHDEVNENITELSKILDVDAKDTEVIPMLNAFVTIFNNLGKKCNQIQEALRIRYSAISELKNLVDYFYMRIDNIDVTENNSTSYKVAQNEWERANSIKTDVELFFRRIDQQIRFITHRILYASKQLTQLQTTFKNESQYRLSIKKLLFAALNSASYSKEAISLSDNFTRKAIPYEKFEFIEVPFIDFGVSKKHPVQKVSKNKSYYKSQKSKVDDLLQIQERTVFWIKRIKETIHSHEEVNFSNYFYKILEEEKIIEIPLQVGFEILKYASESNDFSIEINKEIVHNPLNKTIQIWKMKIFNQKIISLS